jgi:integrase
MRVLLIKEEITMKKRFKKSKGLYLRGKTWWMTYKRLDGKQHWESCHTTIKTEAQAMLEQRRVSIREGKVPEIKRIKPASFTELAKEYEVWAEKQRGFKSKRGFIKKLVDNFGSQNLSHFRTQAVEQYQTYLLKQGLKNASANRILSTLKHMITKAVEWEMVPAEILKRVRKVKQLPERNWRLRFLSKEEMECLINTCDLHLRPIVLMALNTGMRKGEVLTLTWDQVDLKHGFILLENTKNGERREIPINQTLRDTLTALPRHITSPYVFWKKTDGKRYMDIKKSFHSALRRAGIKDFRFHDLRHTFASHLVMNGIDLTTVKELLGHKTIAMTMRYAHLAPSHKVKAVASLDQLHDNYMTIQANP